MSSGQTSKKEPAPKPAGEQGATKGRDTGAALRSVYQKTVEETVPSDLLDLLGKLT